MYETNTRELAIKFDTFSYEYEKRFFTSLTIISAAGFASLISFSQTYENPESFLKAIVPSLWGFVIGLVLSGSLPFVLAKLYSHKSGHFAEAHNREQNEQAASKFPEIIASPQALADRSNVERNHFKGMAEQHGANAEKAWSGFSKWRWCKRIITLIASLSIIFAVLWPLLLITINGKIS